MKVEPRDASALVGRRLGEFIVREPMSSGGFGLVFRAEQPALGREAVIKVLHARLRGSQTVIQRFLREAKLASRLDHPYAAHIYAFGAESDGLMWIAMELVRGTPLDKLLEARGAIQLERFAPLLERICQVVHTAHEQGIVHRDLKPANVMVLVRSGQLLPKLLDLGIAKLDGSEPAPDSSGSNRAITPVTGVTALADTASPEFDETETPTGSSDGRLTEDGTVIGSPLYMAPEQWMDAATTDARTDLYALGILSYEALTGKPPFTGGSRYEIAAAHASTAPPKLGAPFPPALDAVLAKVLAKRPADRYATALEFAEAFSAASGVAVELEQLPRIDDKIRIDAITRAPEPLARAVAAFDVSRNPHQARDVLWQLIRVATRFIGVIALAAHRQIGATGRNSGLEASLRRLVGRVTAESEWLALARELSAPFDNLRAAYPMPELLELLARRDSALERLIALREDDKLVDDKHIRSLLERATPLVGEALVELGFLGEYQLAVTTAQGAERWIGLASQDRATFSIRATTIDPDQAVFVDTTGVPVVALHPFVQVAEPAPGMSPQLFLIEGRGRRGTRLVALPDAFEMEDEALHEVLGGLLGDSSTDLDRSGEEVCPYPGLSAFSSHDATRFFGRERETEAFVNRLRATAFVAIVGPSGAGKSSFVQAGVIPALPDNWRVVTLRPGSSPLASLAARMSSFADPQILRTELDRNPDALGQLLRSRQEPGTTLIVVDQFEELFTLCDDAVERERFAEILARAARSPEEAVRVVITLRDDFLIHAEALPALKSRIATNLQLLTTPGPAELRRIFLEPLHQIGYTLDDASLVDDMTIALERTRTPLALLSFTCSKLWELRDRRFRQLSRKAYTSLGGVGGALAKHAEGVLATMPPNEQRLVREVFRHAVTADGTRAVLDRDELGQMLGDASEAAVASTIEKLIAARLLVSAESADGGEQIEITHEALIGAWPRLVGWRTEDAEGARLRDQLRAAAKQWDERGRSDGLVWGGDALTEYRLWRQRHPGGLGALETAFAEASLAQDRRIRRRRAGFTIAGFTVIVAGIVALAIFNARVARQRARAEENEQKATDSERLTKQAAEEIKHNLQVQYEDTGRRYVIGGDPLAGLAYLDKARELGATGAAHDLVVALAASAVANRQLTLTHDGSVRMAAFAPDESRIVTSGADGRARLWDRSGKLIADLPHKGGVNSIAFARDGSLVALAVEDGATTVWDAHTGAPRGAVAAGEELQVAALTGDNQLVTVASDDIVKLWKLDGQLVATLQATSHASAAFYPGRPLAISPDGKRIAAGDSLGVLRVWEASSRQLVFEVPAHSQHINSVAFSKDGKWLVTSANDNTARIVDAARGRAESTLRHHQQVASAEFSPDARLVATASVDRTAVIWDRATAVPLQTLQGHTAAVNQAVFRRDGLQLATCSDDHTAMLWDVTSGHREAQLTGHDAGVNTVTFDRAGNTLLTASADGTAMVWSAGAPLSTLRRQLDRNVVLTLEYSSDSKRIVTGDENGAIHVWDRATGVDQLVARQQDSVYRARFSPDGKYLVSIGGKLAHAWDARTGTELSQYAGHTALVEDVAWFPDSEKFATVSIDGSLRIWHVGSKEPLLVVRNSGDKALRAIDISPRGDRVVTAGTDLAINIWDARSGQRLTSWSHGSPIGIIEFSPDGERILGNTRAGSRIWSSSGKTLGDLRIKGGDIVNARWSHSGKFIVTASFDGTLRLFDSTAGNELAVLDAGIEKLGVGAIAPDEGSIAGASFDGSVIVWSLPKRKIDTTALMCAIPFRVGEQGLEKVATTCNLETLHLNDHFQ